LTKNRQSISLRGIGDNSHQYMTTVLKRNRIVKYWQPRICFSWMYCGIARFNALKV